MSSPTKHPSSLQSADANEIPIIDLSRLRSPLLKERKKLAGQIYDACTNVGFFYIKNHGIPEDLISELHSVTRRFFSLSDDQKMKYYVGKSKKYRGYMPLYSEQPTGSEVDDPTEQKSMGALSESFDIGYEIAGDAQRDPNDALPTDTFSLYGDNQWPGDELVPGLRETYLRYFAQALDLCRSMMRIFALALDLEEGFFDDKLKYPGATSRMLHYPPQPVEGAVVEGLGAHTDYECFTILSQDQVPALQIHSNTRQGWILAPPIPGTLVVNISDCLSIWTNKKFKSTIHRVTNLTGQERYTIPFFFGVDYDTTVSVLPNCISQERPACSEPFKVGEFVRQQLGKAYVGFSG
ncbi:2OG-Fe(II) oxygenase family oxidoreductase [Aspergillus steynii IBT 23096]|uniref:2OG-Fe(II) oxygenase family oxidoreductase n=1 Tax=Aspergillus steynii IBT 23096 TaxID=1392250 RepID=A0A2I2GBX6_9EURO|nr:2OG-Fe(II) oxygenase family oxidoreductase [Aspergillus steynii IBT 23096]PLB50347.1 2OG-Fe(II) oxygenase family oxidoreductase [Aspergillus steynii IBT 23096]